MTRSKASLFWVRYFMIFTKVINTSMSFFSINLEFKGNIEIGLRLVTRLLLPGF